MTEAVELSVIDPLDPVLASASDVALQGVDPLSEALPTTAVKWENFERLLLRIGHDVLGLRDVKRFGSAGQAQKGIDVVGLDADLNAVAIQSKRYQTFTRADLDKAVDKFLDSSFPFTVNRLIIGVACTVTERSIIERVTELNTTHDPLHIEIWDQERISELLRDQPSIVIEFFGPATAERFCLPHIVTPIAVPSKDAVDTADAIVRGPLRSAHVELQLEQARVKSETHPNEALELYGEVQEKLQERGFPGHAAEFDKNRVPLLVRVGRTGDALKLIMRMLWQSERAGDSAVADRCQRDIERLLEGHDDLRDNPAWKAARWAASLVADSLASPVPHRVGGDLTALADLDPTDRARLLLLITESDLGDDRTDRVLELADNLRQSAAEVCDDPILQSRILIAVADTDGDWKQLVRAARISLPKEAAALVHARYARHLAGKGDYTTAQDEWSEAIDNACLTQRHSDAAKWLYSQREIATRYSGILTDRWHPLAREIANLPGQPRLATAAQRSRESGLAALNAGRDRVAAISLRRYLRDSIISGALADERDARSLLGSVFMKSGHPDLAAHQYVYAGRPKEAEQAARALGDKYYNVAELVESPHQWIAATALRFAAAQADLIPDSQVPTVVDSALCAIDEVLDETRAESFFDPSLQLAAYTFIASVADRLTESQALKVIALLDERVTAPPNAGWHTDKSHVQIMSGITRTHTSLRETAIDQLLGLFERESHWFGTTESQVLVDNLDLTGSRLRLLADRVQQPHHDAAALLALHDDQKPSQARLDAAAEYLQKDTKNGPGRYGVGTRVVEQSLVALHLPVEDRIRCIEALLTKAKSPYEGAENRRDYHHASSNLVDDLPERQRADFFDRAFDLARTAPMSEPDGFHTSLGDPLGFMRWNGVADSRPSALLLAARLAKTDAEQKAIRDQGIQLATNVLAGHRDLAQALIVLDGHVVEPFLGVLAAAPQKELRCAAAVICVRNSDGVTAERLAADEEPIVRRVLAREIGGRDQLDNTVAALRRDPRWSVRVLVQDANA